MNAKFSRTRYGALIDYDGPGTYIYTYGDRNHWRRPKTPEELAQFQDLGRARPFSDADVVSEAGDEC